MPDNIPNTKLFARAERRGRVYAFESGSSASSILCAVVRRHGVANVSVLPMGLGADPGVEAPRQPGLRLGKLSDEHLARAGDRPADALAFLAGLGYFGFEPDPVRPVTGISGSSPGTIRQSTCHRVAAEVLPSPAAPTRENKPAGRCARPVKDPTRLLPFDQLRRVPSNCISIMNRLMKSR
jgi:hypothetical protein